MVTEEAIPLTLNAISLMHQKKHERWMIILHLVQQCEDKYGSIKKTSPKYPPFIKLQKLCAEKVDQNQIALAPEIQKKIARKVDQGYSTAVIAKQFHTGPDTVTKIADFYQITKKPPFYYVLYKKGKPSFYFHSIHDAMITIFHKAFATSKARAEYLKANGYRLRCHNTVWKNIPIGSYYMNLHSKTMHKKSSQDYVDD